MASQYFYLWGQPIFICSNPKCTSSAVVLPINTFHFAHLCMKYSLGISNFLEEISSLSHSIVFLYFFALITEEGFLISPCYSFPLHSNGNIFPFLLCLSLLFFSQLFVRPHQKMSLCFCISFSWGGLDPCLLYNVTNLHL